MSCRTVSPARKDYKQGLVDADCPNPLILALLQRGFNTFFIERLDGFRTAFVAAYEDTMLGINVKRFASSPFCRFPI